jgi:rhodanese-related sulfurtransferase
MRFAGIDIGSRTMELVVVDEAGQIKASFQADTGFDPITEAKKQHMPGAVQFLFPIPDMKEWDTKETDGKSTDDFKQLLGDNKEKSIVIYCGFVKCTRSHNGAAWAVKLGYKNVYRYPGGIFAWKGADFPIEKAE